MVGSLPRGMPKVVDCRQIDAQATKQDGDARMHGALKKKEKDFFPNQVCPLVFLKRNVSDPWTIIVLANNQSVGVDKISTFTTR